MMNTQQKESGLLHLLLECVNDLEDAKLCSAKDLKLYRHNFKLLYNDVNNLDVLNESDDSFNMILESDWNKPDLQMQIKSNVYIKLKRMLNHINLTDATLIKDLNESLKPVKSLKDAVKYDISGFKMELNSVLNRLKNQDDLKHIPPDILKIKTSLQASINVFGTDLYQLVNELHTHNTSIFAVVYNKSEHDLIIVSANNDGTISFFRVYSILDDNFYNLSEKYKFTSASVPNVHNYLQILKDNIGNNLVPIYVDSSKFNLKFTDNIYKDGARLAAIENYKRQHLLTNADMTNMINDVLM